jgi:hypothetical protein
VPQNPTTGQTKTSIQAILDFTVGNNKKEMTNIIYEKRMRVVRLSDKGKDRT